MVDQEVDHEVEETGIKVDMVVGIKDMDTEEDMDMMRDTIKRTEVRTFIVIFDFSFFIFFKSAVIFNKFSAHY